MALKFKEISKFKNGYAVVRNFDDSYQYLHKSGNLIPGKFYHISEDTFHDGLGLVETKYQHYNFVDEDGNLLLKEDLYATDKPSVFTNGFAKINHYDNEGKPYYTFIDQNGKQVGKQKFLKADDFINGCAEVVTEDNQVGFMDSKGRIFTDKTWEKFHNFNDGLALIKDNKGKYYYINEKGKRVSKKYTFAQDYSEGLAVVGELRKVYRYIDTNGKDIKGSYANASKFSEGHAIVSNDNHNFFIIDKSGNRVSETSFSGTIRDIKDGMVLERSTSNGYTFYNLKGKKINNDPFEYAEDFNYGYASVKLYSNGWTCMDKLGNYIPFVSPNHFRFSEEGLAKIQVEKTDLDGNKITKYKFINHEGRDATEEFDDADDFSEGLAVVRKGNAYLVIDKNGNYLGNASQTNSQHEFKDAYGFKYMSLTNDELLHEYIGADTSIFLHGPSGVGKSTRVKALDPTATRITLRPQMNPEEIDGTLDREDGTFIPPLWYKQLKEKCEAEPDRKHVLFIDELTNVKPTIQSLVYSIVLERAGKDGLWPLPENSVVVAAGNETKNNLAAHPLTNALYRRFCHITYNVDKADWISWATTKNKDQKLDCVKVNDEKVTQKIHPTILCYIMANQEKVLNQSLDENNPTIVTDPRKWEIANKILNTTKNPYALVPAIGQNLTDDFISFIKLVPDNLVESFKDKDKEEKKDQLLDFANRKEVAPVYNITIVNDQNKKDHEMYSAIAQLSFVDEDRFEETKDLIEEVYGEKIGKMFDTIWTNNAKPDDSEDLITLSGNAKNNIFARLDNNSENETSENKSDYLDDYESDYESVI